MAQVTKPNYVYVASSWANPMHIAVCAALKSVQIDHYDFKNPDNAEGFHWSSVMESYSADRRVPGQQEQLADMEDYIKALDHPRAIDGYLNDFNAMVDADCMILVLPCGRSAHLELGWAVGRGLRTAILLDPNEDGKVTPELMYRMVDYLAPSLFDLLGWLGVED